MLLELCHAFAGLWLAVFSGSLDAWTDDQKTLRLADFARTCLVVPTNPKLSLVPLPRGRYEFRHALFKQGYRT